MIPGMPLNVSDNIGSQFLTTALQAQEKNETVQQARIPEASASQPAEHKLLRTLLSTPEKNPQQFDSKRLAREEDESVHHCYVWMYGWMVTCVG